jgi:hypothetical protein
MRSDNSEEGLTMSRTNGLVGFGAGLLAGVLLTIVLSGGQEVPRAMAQAPPTAPGPSQRYALSAWSYPGTANDTRGSISPASYGAYIVDAQTGKVWVSTDGANLKQIGTAQ